MPRESGRQRNAAIVLWWAAYSKMRDDSVSVTFHTRKYRAAAVASIVPSGDHAQCSTHASPHFSSWSWEQVRESKTRARPSCPAVATRG